MKKIFISLFLGSFLLIYNSEPESNLKVERHEQGLSIEGFGSPIYIEKEDRSHLTKIRRGGQRIGLQLRFDTSEVKTGRIKNRLLVRDKHNQLLVVFGESHKIYGVVKIRGDYEDINGALIVPHRNAESGVGLCCFAETNDSAVDLKNISCYDCVSNLLISIESPRRSSFGRRLRVLNLEDGKTLLDVMAYSDYLVLGNTLTYLPYEEEQLVEVDLTPFIHNRPNKILADQS